MIQWSLNVFLWPRRSALQVCFQTLRAKAPSQAAGLQGGTAQPSRSLS